MRKETSWREKRCKRERDVEGKEMRREKRWGGKRDEERKKNKGEEEVVKVFGLFLITGSIRHYPHTDYSHHKGFLGTRTRSYFALA